MDPAVELCAKVLPGSLFTCSSGSDIQPSWTIASRPCSAEEDEEAIMTSLAYSTMQYGGQTLSLSIKPSTAWAPEDLAQLGTLISSRNRFVCMQLVTMAKEQHQRVQAAATVGDAVALHIARYMFLGTVTVEQSQEVVAAGLFYPRGSSKDGVESPHMYLELLCCNSPGKGYGTVLLQHIEQYVACGCDYLSTGFFGTAGVAAAAAEVYEPMQTDTPVSARADGDEAGSLLTPAAATAAVVGAVLPVLRGGPGGCCIACSSSNSSDCSSSNECSITLDLTSTAASAGVAEAAAEGTAAAAVAVAPTLVPVILSHAPATSAAAAAGPYDALGNRHRSPAKRIQGIKLMSVESAQAFYVKHGYGADVCKEMFKPLLKLARISALGSSSGGGSSSAANSSSSNVMC